MYIEGFGMERPLADRLREYLNERKKKADRLDMGGEEKEGRDLLATQEDGHYMRAEAEGRKDELDRIWNKFLEGGD